MPLLPVFLLALAASQAPVDQSPIDVLGNRRFYGRPFISPMGEPFRRRVPHDDPLADWFHKADLNHDGYLTVDEMVADGDRFFAILDANHDGQIDPEEIDYFERVIAPEVQGEPFALGGAPIPSADESAAPDNSQKYATRISGGGGHEHRSDGAGRYGLLNTPEPVTSADTNFNGSVSLDEFRAAARRRFDLLDQSQAGRIALSQLER